MWRFTAAFAIVLMSLGGGAGYSQATGILYGSDQFGNLFTVNTTTGEGTRVGPPSTLGLECCTEIEYDALTGQAYAQDRNGNNLITPFDIHTGVLSGAPVNDGGAFAGLEFVGSTLFGTVTVGPGGMKPSTLFTLNPVTGATTPIGATGVNAIAGLAWDGTTLYGIAGGPGPADLYSISLATGVATVIGSTGLQFGSLEFGPDGRLYAGGTGAENGGRIYTLDSTSAAPTLLGLYGLAGGVTGLTLVPEPSAFFLLLAALLGLAASSTTRAG